MTRMRSFNNAESSDKWKVGNLERDFSNLEQAINFTRSEEYLDHHERIETLDFMAKQRRRIRPALLHFFGLPLTMSFAMWIALRKQSEAFVAVCSNLSHMYMAAVVIFPPVILLLVRLSTAEQEIDIPPPELKNVPREMMRFVTSWEDPYTSTKDYVRCLLEQWTSAIAGLAFTGRHKHPAFRIIATLAAWVSLHQFPKLLHDLLRDSYPRPLPWSVWSLRTATLLLQSWSTRSIISLDLALLLCFKPFHLGISVYGFLWIALMIPLIRPQVCLDFQRRKQLIQMLGAIGCARFLRHICYVGTERDYWNMQVSSFLQANPANVVFTQQAAWKVVSGALSIVSIIVPIAHLLSFVRLIVISKTNFLLLGLDSVPCQETESKRPPVWRYRLRWRTPKRVHVIADNWERRAFHWLFFEGKVRTMLETEKLKSRRMKPSLLLWNRAKLDNFNFSERSEWADRPRKLLAARFKEEKEAQSNPEDPLGAFVFQVLGIPLGFRFDHVKKVRDNKLDNIPKTRRLQSRAAKSAVFHIEQLKKQHQTALDQIASDEERVAAQNKLENDLRIETERVADRLNLLVPTDTPHTLEIESMMTKLLLNRRETSPSVEKLKAWYLKSSGQIDYLNPRSGHEDHEFIEDWKLNANLPTNNTLTENQHRTYLA